MMTKYGHVCIEWGGVEYRLTPSLKNIATIGSPKEIVDDFKRFLSCGPVWRFAIALGVVNACSDKELPESLTGSVAFGKTKSNLMYVKPKHDLDMFNDITVLGEHLFIHGVCGRTDEKGGGKPMESFDAYEIMEIARCHLDLPSEEAKNLTMTEFSRMMKAKFPSEKKEDRISPDEDAAMLAWFEKNNGVH